MRPGRPTRRDVASLAGVAPWTVTLVLQGRGDEIGIAKATQGRIQEAARSLGYYPNRQIRAILRGRTNTIGLYLRFDQWSRPYGYWTQSIWEIQRAIAETDLRLLIHNAHEDISAEEAYAGQAGGIVDGVIILNSANDPIVSRLLEAQLPAVELGDPFSQLPFVGVDGASGIRLALEHLRERGYRYPALLGHRTNYEQNASLRTRTFRSCLEEFFGVPPEVQREARVLYGSEGFDVLMALRPKPDCVVCLGDELAYEFLHESYRRGLRVPDDVAITGFDALQSLCTLRVMTSVQTPLEDTARLGLKKLQAIIKGQPYEQATLLPVNLRVGDTT